MGVLGRRNQELQQTFRLFLVKGSYYRVCMPQYDGAAQYHSGLLQEALALIVCSGAGVILQAPLPLRPRTTGPLLALLVVTLPPCVERI